MGAIGRAFRLMGASWRTLMADRELLWLPVLGFAATTIAIAAIALVSGGVGVVERWDDHSPASYALLAAVYFVSYSIAIYFNAAIVGAAMIRLKGGNPTLSDGLSLATSKLPKILGWAAVAATVGLFLRVLEDKAPFVGKIVIAIVGAAWSAVTFFVVPVLLFEPLGVGESVKRSGEIFKKRWGETFVGSASIGLALFLLSIPALLLVVFVAMASPVAGVVLGVVVVGALFALGAALSGVFNAALYLFATTGETSAGFAADDLNGTFRPKKGS